MITAPGDKTVNIYISFLFSSRSKIMSGLFIYLFYFLSNEHIILL